MCKSNKSFFSKLQSIIFGLFLSTIFTSFVFADANDTGNVPDEENIGTMSSQENVELPFEPNNYNFLIYDSDGSESEIEEAMDSLGISYDVRDPYNEITLDDLATHDILIVGWNAYGDTSGIDANVLVEGITGRIILSGHDLDYHTIKGNTEKADAARTMLIQAINYVLSGGGTGLITLGCTDAFPYIPDEWGVSAIVGGSETITEFTSAGLESGVYNGLEPTNLSNWTQAYHDTFTIDTGSDFVSFELGYDDANVTIARTAIFLPSGCENLSLTKIDNTEECVYPSFDELGIDITVDYNISYGFGPNCDINDINLIDTLPAYVDYNSSTPEGIYDPCTHTVRWNLGDFADSNETNSITLTVVVASDAPQGSTLTNTIRMYSGEDLIKTASESTTVCCDSDTIFVDSAADSGGDGKSWDTAYNDLQTALTNITTCTSKISSPQEHIILPI